MNDFELIYLAQENNEQAYDLLYNKYKSLLYSFIIKYNNINKNRIKDSEDIKVDIFMCFQNCINNFDDSNDNVFSTYLYQCLENTIKKEYRKVKSINFYNSMISLDDEPGKVIINTFESNNYKPETFLEVNEINTNLNKLYHKLSGQEKKVFYLRILGRTYKEISDEMQINLKKVYKAMDRIRIKYNYMLQDN